MAYGVYGDWLWKERRATMSRWQKVAHVALVRVIPVSAFLFALLVLIGRMTAPRPTPSDTRFLTSCCICPCESANR